jgi:hypothetical protein
MRAVHRADFEVAELDQKLFSAFVRDAAYEARKSGHDPTLDEFIPS